MFCTPATSWVLLILSTNSERQHDTRVLIWEVKLLGILSAAIFALTASARRNLIKRNALSEFLVCLVNFCTKLKNWPTCRPSSGVPDPAKFSRKRSLLYWRKIIEPSMVKSTKKINTKILSSSRAKPVSVKAQSSMTSLKSFSCRSELNTSKT